MNLVHVGIAALAVGVACAPIHAVAGPIDKKAVDACGVPAYSVSWGGLNVKGNAALNAAVLGKAQQYLVKNSDGSVKTISGEAQLSLVRQIVGGYAQDAAVRVINNYTCRLAAAYPDKADDINDMGDNYAEYVSDIFSPQFISMPLIDRRKFLDDWQGKLKKKILSQAQVDAAIEDFSYSSLWTMEAMLKGSAPLGTASVCLGTTVQSITAVDTRVLQTLGSIRSQMEFLFAGRPSPATSLLNGLPIDIAERPTAGGVNLGVKDLTCLTTVHDEVVDATKPQTPVTGPPTAADAKASDGKPVTVGTPAAKPAPGKAPDGSAVQPNG